MLRKFLEKVSTDANYAVMKTQDEIVVTRVVDGKTIAREMQSQGKEKNLIVQLDLGEEELNKFGMLL